MRTMRTKGTLKTRINRACNQFLFIPIPIPQNCLIEFTAQSIPIEGIEIGIEWNESESHQICHKKKTCFDFLANGRSGLIKLCGRRTLNSMILLLLIPCNNL